MEDRRIKVLDMIALDTEVDAKRFEGAPFDGKIVGEYFGCLGAQIGNLAKIMKSIIEDRWLLDRCYNKIIDGG